MEQNPVERAITQLGGPTRTIAKLAVASVGRFPNQDEKGISYWTLREWRKAGRVPDSRWALLLSELTDVSAHALAGLEGNGNGDEPRRGQRFRRGGPAITATYHESSPLPSSDLPPAAARIAA